MHIAALDTRFVRREDVTQEILDREREIYKAQAEPQQPEAVIEKIVKARWKNSTKKIASTNNTSSR